MFKKTAKKEAMSAPRRITPQHFFRFLTCPYWVYYEQHGNPEERGEISPLMMKIMEDAVLHEREVISGFKYVEVVEEDLEEKVANLQKKGEDLINEASQVRNNMIKRFEEKKESTSESLVSKMDEAFSKLTDLQKKGVEITEDVHQKYFKKNGKPLAS